MIQRTLRLLTFVLLAGFIASCGVTNPNIESAKIQLKNQAYDKALKAAEAAIKENPKSGLGYFYKGVALSEKASKSSNLEKRQDFYKRMRDALVKAKELFNEQEDPPDEADRIDAVLSTTWTQEYNKAVKFVTTDSLKSQKNYKRAVNHLQNAGTIIPDSTIAFDVMAEVYLMQKPRDLEGAISALKNSVKYQEKPKAKTLERLAQFHHIQKNPEKAKEILEKAYKLYPDSLSIVQQLTDTYFRLDQREKALNLVEDLIEKDPENPRYYKVLGTQIYQSVSDLNDSLETISDVIFEARRKLDKASGANQDSLQKKVNNLEKKDEELRRIIKERENNALENLKKVVELNPKDDQAFNTIGVIFQNRAARIFDKRNLTEDNELAAKYDKQARKELKQSLKYYKKAVDLSPDNKDYWTSLFRVYTTLGMEEKAKKAMKKAGLDKGSGSQQ